jgi:F0F1-type ATP synthase assembly protein I
MAVVRSPYEEKLYSGILRLNSQILGLILGLLLGLAIFIATIWLLIKGGRVDANGQSVVGPHLQLLSQFLIGYHVSFVGSIVGFAYGFAIGTLCGALVGWIYNKFVDLRN